MSPTVFIAAGIVIGASAGFVIVGTVYKWDLASRGYAAWTQVVGTVALLGIAGVGAWERRDEPLVAAGVILGGAALSAGYVLLHRRLTARVREVLNARDSAR